MPVSTEPTVFIAHDATRDPASMPPEDRRREVAAILARGVLRLRQSSPTGPGSGSSRTPEIPAK